MRIMLAADREALVEGRFRSRLGPPTVSLCLNENFSR